MVTNTKRGAVADKVGDDALKTRLRIAAILNFNESIIVLKRRDKNMKRYTLITGASSGIGRAAAFEFAKRDKNLVLVARREEQLQELKSALQSEFPEIEVIVKPYDLSQIDDLENFFTSLEPLFIETWINNAGFGYYTLVQDQEIAKTKEMIQLNVEALTILSILYIRKYHDEAGTQLINISSAGGYLLVPNAITYSASKFYVGAFTEGVALELQHAHAKLQVKVLAPAATATGFGKVANNVEEYDYHQAFSRYHTSEEMATFLMELYDSNKMVGSVDRESFEFVLSDHKFPFAGNDGPNQRLK